MEEVLCPYCCERFTPDHVDFRLDRPLEEETEQKETEVSGGRARRGHAVREEELAKGFVVDEKLLRYYIEKLQMNNSEAESNARRLPAIKMNYEAPDIEYSLQDFSRYGYVTKIHYKGQTLNQRLCPFCHNPLVANAGKYEMLMISMIGDTEVGKSVYLTVLEETLGDAEHDGNLQFMGTEAERAQYRANVEQLIDKKKTLAGTQRVKNAPMPFLYTYRTKDSYTKKNKIIIFTDMAGEDCRDPEILKERGYHLKASDGFMFFIDVTRFPGVEYMAQNRPHVKNREQREVFTAIHKYMIADSYESTCAIPSAVILTKCDELGRVGLVNSTPEFLRLVTDDTHYYCGNLEPERVRRQNESVMRMIPMLGEKRLINYVEDTFSDFSYFVVSALGKAPTEIQGENMDRSMKEMIIEGQIMPFKISEPFFWLLAKKDCIPYYYWETWESSKGKKKNIEMYYFESEKENLNEKIEREKVNQGIKNIWPLVKWQRTDGSSL